jgi:hypothetical protein
LLSLASPSSAVKAGSKAPNSQKSTSKPQSSSWEDGCLAKSPSNDQSRVSDKSYAFDLLGATGDDEDSDGAGNDSEVEVIVHKRKPAQTTPAEIVEIVDSQNSTADGVEGLDDGFNILESQQTSLLAPSTAQTIPVLSQVDEPATRPAKVSSPPSFLICCSNLKLLLLF